MSQQDSSDEIYQEIKRSNRNDYMWFSGIPILTQLRIGNYTIIPYFVIGYVLIGLQLYLMGIYRDCLGCLAVSALILLIHMCVLSIIETEYQLNLMQEPYLPKNCGFDLRLKDYGKGYRLWILITSSLGVITCLAFLIADGYALPKVLVLFGWCIIAIIEVMLVNKFRNVKYSDMPPCPGRDK